MQKVYIELFLLDNALMSYLILKSASCATRLPLKNVVTIVVCVASALMAAGAMVVPIMSSAPAKLVIFCVMCLPFDCKGKKRLWAALWMLVCTFACGGLAFALCYITEGTFTSGMLYGSGTVRAVLLTAVTACFLPRLFVRLRARSRGELTLIKAIICTEYGKREVDLKVDTGNDLHSLAYGLPVIVVAPSVKVFPDGWSLTCSKGEDVALYNTISGSGVMPVLKAEVETKKGKMACMVGRAEGIKGCEALAGDWVWDVDTDQNNEVCL